MQFIKNLLFIMLVLTNDLSTTAIIFLEGASRSGKSSICDAIEKYSHWGVIDSLYSSYSHDLLNKLFPEEFLQIRDNIIWENITPAITKTMFVFKQGVEEAQKKIVFSAVQKIQHCFENPLFYALLNDGFANYALTRIFAHINHGNNLVISGGWFISREKIQQIDPTLNVISALAYCPLEVILERLFQRNGESIKIGNMRTHRFFKELLRSFSYLYDLTMEANGALGKLEKKTLLVWLQKIESCLSETTEAVGSSKFIVREFSCSEFRAYRETLLKKFGDNQFLYVVPKKTYDVVIHTETQNPEACAAQIVARAVC